MQNCVKSERERSLDALRGVAALVVVLHHLALMMAFPEHSLVSAVADNTPLKLFISGHAAVLMFFILSGFALSSMMEPGMAYGTFLVRRVCRIMIPLVAALVVSVGLYFLIQPHEMTNMPDWVNGMIWDKHPTPVAFVRHVFLFGLYNDIFLDTAIWSLIYEMRVSLVFPLIYFFCRRAPRLTTLASVLLFAVTTLYRQNHDTNYVGANWMESLILTVNVAPLFVMGAFLHIYRATVKAKLAALTTKSWIAFLMIAFVLIVDKREAVIAVGSLGIVAWTMSGKFGAAALRRSEFQFLGKISYSLYLTHMIVLGAFAHLCHASLNRGTIAGLTLLASIGFATMFYHAVEMPSQSLGRRWGKNTGNWGKTGDFSTRSVAPGQEG